MDKFKTQADRKFVNLIQELKEDGVLSSPRGLKTLELEDATVTLENPSIKDSIVTLPERNLSIKYLLGEMRWYRKGSYNVEEIAKYSKFWNNISENGKVNSNYGQIVFRDDMSTDISNVYSSIPKNQYDWCLKQLKEDSDTRKAILNYNQPVHKTRNPKDFVCTIGQLFRIKNGQLDTRVFMRSTDLIYGWSFDIVFFTYLLNKMAKDLKIKVGNLMFYTASLHIYEKHFEMVDKIYETYK